MNLSDIQHIGVVGAGTMGHGIAQVCATTGYRVTLVDVDASALSRAQEKIAKSAAKLHEKGAISAEQLAAIPDLIQVSTDLTSLADAQIVIEAASESQVVKRRVFADLDTTVQPDAILATNTSSISITEIAAITSRPSQVIGMHFMNPVPLMQLVEVIRGLTTAPETVAVVLDLSRALGKTPIEASDYPGFIANRILMPMINEAIYCVMEGVGTVAAIDTVMKLGANHPMGPLTLADLIGLDVVLSILDVMHAGLGDPKYRPCPLLRQMVAANHLGRKTSKGFYDYNQ